MSRLVCCAGVKVNLSSITDAVESSALGYQYNYVDVYSNSWGPPDNGYYVRGPGYLTSNTLENGVTRVCSSVRRLAKILVFSS